MLASKNDLLPKIRNASDSDTNLLALRNICLGYALLKRLEPYKELSTLKKLLFK